jgi:hypothetical protein
MSRVTTAPPTAIIPRLAPNDGGGTGRVIGRGGKWNPQWGHRVATLSARLPQSGHST